MPRIAATSPRRLIVLLLMMLALLAAAAPASAGGLRGKMLRLINDERRSHGVGALVLDLPASRMAGRHSQRMSERNLLFHTPNLDVKLADRHWRVLGENIAFGSRVRGIVRMWMASTEHRANILKAGYRRIGIGLYRGRGHLWATTYFWG